MTAKVSTPPGPFKYRAWCHACQDGLNAQARVIAQEWATIHNRNHIEAPANAGASGFKEDE